MSRTRIISCTQLAEPLAQEAARALAQGALAVLPTDTVYGLGTGAFCEEAIQQIYALKQRPANSPLQILTGSLEQSCQIVDFPAGALRLAQAYWPGALTLIVPPSRAGKPLTRGFAGLGLRVPGNNFLVNLLQRLTMPLSCTSANVHGQPVLTREEDIIKTFDGKVDFIFLGGTLSPVASSVVDVTKEGRLLREGALSRAELERVYGEPLLLN